MLEDIPNYLPREIEGDEVLTSKSYWMRKGPPQNAYADCNVIKLLGNQRDKIN
jgi:hypothetical protein